MLNTKTTQSYLNPKIFKILKKLYLILQNDYSFVEYSIFLCGGAGQDQARFRRKLGRKIASLKSRFMYSVYYPEDLFLELMYGHSQHNLLSLENFLAKSVDSVVIPLESPGTFTELGAFVNHDELRKKVIAIVKPKYKNNDSFINKGPIALLKTDRRESVMYSNLEEKNITTLAYNITSRIRGNRNNSEKIVLDLSNPIASQLFYLCVVYLLDPLSIDHFRMIVRYFNKEGNEVNLTILEETILNRVHSHNNIGINSQHQLICKEGGFVKILQSKGLNKEQVNGLLNSLSNLRIACINLYYRNNGGFI